MQAGSLGETCSRCYKKTLIGNVVKRYAMMEEEMVKKGVMRLRFFIVWLHGLLARMIYQSCVAYTILVRLLVLQCLF